MKPYWLITALALCVPHLAWTQSSDLPPLCEALDADCDGDSDCVVVSVCAPYPEVVAVGERIGHTKRDEITSPVSILDGVDIAARNQQYVSDLLRSLPGISVNSSGPAGGLTQIRLRGTEASHVLVLIDGVEVSNPNAGEFDFAGLRTADILRIEVLRGEQSALYGSDAVGGVINIITQVGETGHSNQTRLGLEYGGDNMIEGRLQQGIKLGNAYLNINGTASNMEGYDISGLGGEKDGSRSRAFNIGLRNLQLGGLTINATSGFARYRSEFDSDDNFDGRLEDTNGFSTVENLTGRVDARFNLGGAEGISNVVTLSHSDTDTDSRAAFTSRSVGKRTKLTWAAKKKIDAHSLTLLGEGEHESYAIMPNFAFDPDTPKNKTYAIAADYRYHKDSLTLSGSARHDFNDRFKDAVTWRAGAGYKIDALNGRLRASYGNGVKNPSLIELFGFFPESNFVGNPDLSPEKSKGFSVGYDQEIDNLTFSVDYFNTDLENEIFTDFSSFPFLARNRSTDSTREGVELEAAWSSKNLPFFARASATFLDAKENGVKEIRRPDFLASATASYDINDFSQITVSVDHTGSQTDTDFATFLPVTLDAFTLVGANWRYQVNDAVTLTIRGENLLNEDYQEVAGYASPGRAVFGGVSAGF